jgi:hypothetical protein
MSSGLKKFGKRLSGSGEKLTLNELIALLRIAYPVIREGYEYAKDLIRLINKADGITDEQRKELLKILEVDPREIGIDLQPEDTTEG